MELFRLIENYAQQIAAQERQLGQLREQRAAIVGVSHKERCLGKGSTPGTQAVFFSSSGLSR